MEMGVLKFNFFLRDALKQNRVTKARLEKDGMIPHITISFDSVFIYQCDIS